MFGDDGRLEAARRRRGDRRRRDRRPAPRGVPRLRAPRRSPRPRGRARAAREARRGRRRRGDPRRGARREGERASSPPRRRCSRRSRSARASAAPRKGKKARSARKTPSPAEAADALAPSPAIVKALLDALARPAVDLDPELSDTLIDAVGALAIKEAKPRLDALCRSSYPTTREHAAKALGLLGDKKACPAHAGRDAPRELDALVAAKTTIAFDADVGRADDHASIPRSRRRSSPAPSSW